MYKKIFLEKCNILFQDGYSCLMGLPESASGSPYIYHSNGVRYAIEILKNTKNCENLQNVLN